VTDDEIQIANSDEQFGNADLPNPQIAINWAVFDARPETPSESLAQSAENRPSHERHG
jgi:hypothetical protein